MTFDYSKTFQPMRHEFYRMIIFFVGSLLVAFLVGFILSRPFPRRVRIGVNRIVSVVIFVACVFYFLYHITAILNV